MIDYEVLVLITIPTQGYHTTFGAKSQEESVDLSDIFLLDGGEIGRIP
jgi:hypothetical protein